MIDFQNKVIFKLKNASNKTYASLLQPLLVGGEEIISTYQTIRDGVVFTNKRILRSMYRV